jgi:HSP20 family protein
MVRRRFMGRNLSIPAVNIAEQKDERQVSFAAPGLKKDDFNINADRNMLTNSSVKEENKGKKDKRFTSKEYLALPEEINKKKIKAKYEDCVLKISLPCKEEAKKPSAKHIAGK